MGKVIIRDPDYATLKAFADVLASKGYNPKLQKAYAGRANTIEVEVPDSIRSIDIPLRKAKTYFGILGDMVVGLPEDGQAANLMLQVEQNKHHSPFDREGQFVEQTYGDENIVDNTKLFDVIDHNIAVKHENTQSLQTDRMISGDEILKGE